MNLVQKFETFDGKLHDSQEAAGRHLEDLKMELIGRIAHRVVAVDFKWTKIVELLAAELETMRQLVRISDDMTTDDSE